MIPPTVQRDEEGQEVLSNEELGELCDMEDRARFSLGGMHYAAKDHVDCCREKCGGDGDKDRLHGLW